VRFITNLLDWNVPEWSPFKVQAGFWPCLQIDQTEKDKQEIMAIKTKSFTT